MLRIGVVEDNVFIRKLIIKIVKSEDIEIDEFFEASNGVEALEKINGYSVDMVFIDYKMPKMTGIEFTRVLHSSAMHSNVPVVMVTAYDNESLKQEAVDIGIKAFILKPFSPEQITNELRNCLTKRF